MQKEVEQIYEKNKNDIYRLALSYTNNISDAEDIVANTFVKLYKNISKIKDSEHLKKRLIKVTINECKNLAISYWKRKIFLITEKEENTISTKQASNELIEALQCLATKDRIIIHLYYYENYKTKEIADIMKMTESNIKIRLHRSRKQLKEILKEEE